MSGKRRKLRELPLATTLPNKVYASTKSSNVLHCSFPIDSDNRYASLEDGAIRYPRVFFIILHMCLIITSRMVTLFHESPDFPKDFGRKTFSPVSSVFTNDAAS